MLLYAAFSSEYTRREKRRCKSETESGLQQIRYEAVHTDTVNMQSHSDHMQNTILICVRTLTEHPNPASKERRSSSPRLLCLPGQQCTFVAVLFPESR